MLVKIFVNMTAEEISMDFKHVIGILVKLIYNENIVKSILKESSIGMPFITNLRYATSENTIHQIYHISKYYSETGKDILKAKTIVEWGGGYGCV